MWLHLLRNKSNNNNNNNCSSAAPTVRRLPSAVRTTTPAFDVRSPGFFLRLTRWPGTRYQTTFKIRDVLLTVFVVIEKLFFSRSTSVHSALQALWLCAIQIYYWQWHWHWHVEFIAPQCTHSLPAHTQNTHSHCNKSLCYVCSLVYVQLTALFLRMWKMT